MQIEQSQFQDQLVRGLAHRMNNILTLFHGYLGMIMEDEKLDESVRTRLAKVRDGADAASELMDRTHSLVRPSALVWREINLTEFVPMQRVVFDQFCAPGTRIEIVCADEIPPVLADVTRLKTALLEIVRNACEAASRAEGDGVVSIRVDKESAKGPGRISSAAQPLHWVTITVTDNGPGIAPEAEEKMFQPFFTFTSRPGATGLGLTVAASMVQQIGGFIRHESQPGRTSFQIVLRARNDIARAE